MTTKRLDHFMNDALTAYYGSRDPFGLDGDFITAPEISQLFGEIIGIWAIQQWVRIGSPSHVNLIEIGPGRGTLMADLCRGTQHVKAFHDAMDIHFIETSAILIQKQKETLKNHKVSWHSHLDEIDSDIPSIIIANEFFDALPVRQFQRQHDEWTEHYIENNQSVWMTCDDPPLKQTLPLPEHGDIFEYSKIQKEYIELLNNYNGAALIIDYGYMRSSYGDSLQALYKHAPCAITNHIGHADLTTHIDFEWLSNFLENRKTTLSTQAAFLQTNGIDLRFKQLDEPEQLKDGYERLITPDQMGQLFKVMEVF